MDACVDDSGTRCRPAASNRRSASGRSAPGVITDEAPVCHAETRVRTGPPVTMRQFLPSRSSVTSPSSPLSTSLSSRVGPVRLDTGAISPTGRSLVRRRSDHPSICRPTFGRGKHRDESWLRSPLAPWTAVTRYYRHMVVNRPPWRRCSHRGLIAFGRKVIRRPVPPRLTVRIGSVEEHREERIPSPLDAVSRQARLICIKLLVKYRLGESIAPAAAFDGLNCTDRSQRVENVLLRRPIA